MPTNPTPEQLIAAAREVSKFLRRCRGTEPAEYFDNHAWTCDQLADALAAALAERPEKSPPDAVTRLETRKVLVHPGMVCQGENCPICASSDAVTRAKLEALADRAAYILRDYDLTDMIHGLHPAVNAFVRDVAALRAHLEGSPDAD